MLLSPSDVWHHICHHENPHKLHPAVVRFTTDVTYGSRLWKTIWWGRGLVEVSCKYSKGAEMTSEQKMKMFEGQNVYGEQGMRQVSIQSLSLAKVHKL